MVTREVDAARAAIVGRTGEVEVGLILGSGLGGYADTLEGGVRIPYGSIPHMPASTVEGHAGHLVVGRRAGRRIAVLEGRTHLYEGRTPNEVVFGVRLVAALGATTLVVTNAAGGIATGFEPGDLMAIADHLNLTGTSSLIAPHGELEGERFVDMTAAYEPELIELAKRSAKELGLQLKTGVYAGLLGPAYETPAEVRMLATLGADAVGMSTVLEVLAARHLGLRVLGISCISNLAAGISGRPLTHAEVEETAGEARERFEALLTRILEAM